jgi:hypothetical protein
MDWLIYFYTSGYSNRPIAATYLRDATIDEALNQDLPDFINYSDTYYIKPVNLSEKDNQEAE